MRLLLICLGGGLGSGLRYLVTLGMAASLGATFPYGTLAVNVSGSLLIGLIQEAALTTAAIPVDLRLFLTAGVMGGYTTYSSFSYETLRLFEDGAWLRAGLYLALTTVACLGACFLGIALARALIGLRGG